MADKRVRLQTKRKLYVIPSSSETESTHQRRALLVIPVAIFVLIIVPTLILLPGSQSSNSTAPVVAESPNHTSQEALHDILDEALVILNAKLKFKGVYEYSRPEIGDSVLKTCELMNAVLVGLKDIVREKHAVFHLEGEDTYASCVFAIHKLELRGSKWWRIRENWNFTCYIPLIEFGINVTVPLPEQGEVELLSSEACTVPETAFDCSNFTMYFETSFFREQMSMMLTNYVNLFLSDEFEPDFRASLDELQREP